MDTQTRHRKRNKDTDRHIRTKNDTCIERETKTRRHKGERKTQTDIERNKIQRHRRGKNDTERHKGQRKTKRDIKREIKIQTDMEGYRETDRYRRERQTDTVRETKTYRHGKKNKDAQTLKNNGRPTDWQTWEKKTHRQIQKGRERHRQT